MSPKDEKLPVFESRFSRRSLLHGMGAISLTALVPRSLLAEEASGAAGKLAAAAPRFGALFNPYHRPDDWNLLVKGGPEGMPLLGAYASETAGAAVTQIIWAKQMGVQFFLASYCPGRSSEGVDALFEAASFTDFSVGLCIDVSDDSNAFRTRTPKARLAAALDQVASRYLSQRAYLRTRSGLAILGIAGADDGGLVEGVLAAGGGSPRWGPVLRFPAAWRAVPEHNSELAQAAEIHGLYLGYSARRGSRASSRVVPTHSKRAAAVFVSPARNGSKRIQLPPRAADAEWVILDSFNNWGVSVPLEPGTKSGTGYVQEVARWSRGDVA